MGLIAFIDLDETLCELDLALEIHLRKLAASTGQIGYHDYEKLTYYGHKLYSKDAPFFRFDPLFSMPKERIEQLLPHDFWATIPLMNNALGLMQKVIDTDFVDKVYILTNPSGLVNASSGKVAWVKRFLRDFSCKKFNPEVDVILCRDKWLLAGPNRILVDDLEINCSLFLRSGGKAIQYVDYRDFEKKWESLEREHLIFS